MSKKFTRTIEDFTCERCQTRVAGNGYTNHCPECLWSKHVDVQPGDRAESCGGLMAPTGIIRKGNDYRLEHTCTRCGAKKSNKTVPADSYETMLGLARSGTLKG